MTVYKYKISDFSPEDFKSFEPFCEKEPGKRKPQSIVAHYHLKKLLAEYYNTDIKQICFNYGTHGKPFYKNDLQFSLTHTEDYVYIAISHRKIGIDAEINRKIQRNILSRTASVDEAVKLKISDNFDFDFLKMWTVKEAYFKCTGSGITKPSAISVNEISERFSVRTYTDGECIVSIVEDK